MCFFCVKKGVNPIELFKLFGKVVVDNKEAVENIDKTSKKAKDTSETLAKVGGAFTTVGTTVTNVGRKFLPVTMAVGGMATASLKTASDFDSSMSQVAATMGMTSEEINNGSEDFKKLEKAARDMGKATMFSASDAADALNYLALAGYDVDKSIDTLPTVLNLAAAGGIDLAYASDMVTDAMSALGLETDQAENFVDKMAKTSQKSNTNVAQLGEAILTVGGTAKTLAGGTTELNTALGILADNGVKGAEGGTALRNIILSLSAPTDVAAKKMKTLGLEVYDANGNMRPLNDIFNDLNGVLSTMTQGDQTDVLNTIFNKVDLKSANALLANSGGRFNELSGYLNDCDGAAKNMADTMQNNLNGKITTLKSAISEAAISIGDKFTPIIDKAVDKVQKWTDWFNNLDESQQQTIIKIALLVASIAPLIMLFGGVISSIGNMITTFTTLQGAIGTIKGGIVKLIPALSGMSVPILAVVVAIGVMIAAFVSLWKNNEDFRNKIIALWDGIKQKFIDFGDGIVQRLNALGFSFEDIIDVISAAWQFLCDFLAPQFEAAFKMVSDILGAVLDVLIGLLDVFIGLFTGNWDQLWTGLKEIFVGFWDGIKGFILGILSGLQGFIDAFLEPFGTSLEDIWNGIVDFFSGIGDSISSAFSSCVDAVSPVLETIKNLVEVAIMFIVSLISAAHQLITLPFRFIWENCKDTIIAIWDFIEEKIIAVLGVIENVISTVWSRIKAFLIPILVTIKTVISTVWNGIKIVISTVLNIIKNNITMVWNGIKTIISVVLNGIKTTVTTAFNAIHTVASSVWGKIKEAIVKPITQAKETVSDMIEKIKEKFNFTWELPHLKLPHFKIDGKFSLDPPSVPSFNIDWYAKGGIMKQPTAFGINGNRLMVGGEAGAEAIAPIDLLQDYIRKAVRDENEYNDSSKIIELLMKVIELLISLNSKETSIRIDGRELGRAVHRYA